MKAKSIQSIIRYASGVFGLILVLLSCCFTFGCSSTAKLENSLSTTSTSEEQTSTSISYSSNRSTNLSSLISWEALNSCTFRIYDTSQPVDSATHRSPVLAEGEIQSHQTASTHETENTIHNIDSVAAHQRDANSTAAATVETSKQIRASPSIARTLLYLAALVIVFALLKHIARKVMARHNT